MPKIKTHRGAQKRFKVTKSGKIKHRSTNRNHILTKKAPGRKRQLRKMSTLAPGDTYNVHRLLGNK